MFFDDELTRDQLSHRVFDFGSSALNPTLEEPPLGDSIQRVLSVRQRVPSVLSRVFSVRKSNGFKGGLILSSFVIRRINDFTGDGGD